MPWSDNSDPGPKPGGKPGPWGAPPPSPGNGGRAPDNDEVQRPRGGGNGGGGNGGGPRPRPPQEPEDLTEAFKRLRKRLEPLIGQTSRGVPPRLVAGVVLAVVALWLATGVYKVQPNEQGVVTTFGAWSRTDNPGPHYHLPSPIERVDLVQVTTLRQINVGGDENTANLMLTGDQNIVDMNFTIQWRVNDAAKYLFRVRDADDTVGAVADSAIREVVGRTPLTSLLTTGRGAVQDQTRQLMQRILDKYQAGVTVVDVQIQPNAPKPVIADFQAVTSANEYADSAVNEARTYANKVINEAKGDAAKVVADAQAYREQTVLEAQGDAARFKALDAEYKRSPAATRERLYLETMQRVLAKSNKVIIDAKGSSAPIVLPPDVFRPRTAPTPAAPTADAQPAAPPPVAAAPASPPQPGAPQ